MIKCPIHLKNISTSCGTNLGGIRATYIGAYGMADFTYEYDIIDSISSTEYQALDASEQAKYVQEDEQYVKYNVDLDANKIPSAIKSATLTTGAEPMQAFQFRSQTGSLVQELEANDNGTNFFNITVNLVFAKQDAHKRLAIQSLAMGETCAVVEDNNGKKWFVGHSNPLRLTTSTADTGTAFSDSNSYTLALTTADTMMALPISDEALATLLGE